ncbi:hypothetical protein MMC29_007592 [Sticta canariensis]|nr:hypothetical protein [Sticta canariensis]
MATLMKIAKGAFARLPLLYKHLIAPAWISPLSKIPNAHFTVPIAPIWIWWKRRAGRATWTISALHQRLGPVVRLGPSEISVNSSSGLRKIYGGGFDRHRSYLDLFLNYGTPSLICIMDRELHSTRKRMISHVYAKSYLLNSQDLQTLSGTLLFTRFLPILHSASQNKKPLDVLSLAEALGMDLTSGYLFGSVNGTNFLDNVDYRNHWLEQYSIFKKQSLKERASGEIEKWCFSMCEAAEALETEKSGNTPSTKPVVYRSLFNGLAKSTSSSKQRKVIIASEMLDHLIAGHEASAITITYLMHELSRQPSLQRRLREELRSLSPAIIHPINSQGVQNHATDALGHLPTPSSIDRLPFLNAILQETLRLYAPVSSGNPRVTPSSSVPTTIDGYCNIPGGVTVSSSAYCLHRNPEAFPEPEKWLPERWLEAEKDDRVEMKRWFWPFGSGGMMCLGKNFAIQGEDSSNGFWVKL